MSADDMVAALRFLISKTYVLIPGDPTLAFATREFCCRSRRRWVGLASSSFFGEIPRLFLGQTAVKSRLPATRRSGLSRFTPLNRPVLLAKVLASSRLIIRASVVIY